MPSVYDLIQKNRESKRRKLAKVNRIRENRKRKKSVEVHIPETKELSAFPSIKKGLWTTH